MPGRNGTGPDGIGATGLRGRSAGGRCIGPEDQGFNRNYGRSCGNGRRMGMARGYRRGYLAPQQMPLPTGENSQSELDNLYNEIENLKLAITELSSQISKSNAVATAPQTEKK